MNTRKTKITTNKGKYEIFANADVIKSIRDSGFSICVGNSGKSVGVYDGKNYLGTLASFVRVSDNGRVSYKDGNPLNVSRSNIVC